MVPIDELDHHLDEADHDALAASLDHLARYFCEPSADKADERPLKVATNGRVPHVETHPGTLAA
jgi:hypothetical protein